jgi:hypothetical protein
MKPQVSIGNAKGSWGMTNETKGKGPNSPTYNPSQSRGHVHRSQAQTPGGGQKVISRDRGIRGALGLDQGDQAIDPRLRGHVPAAHGLIGTISAVVGAESRSGVQSCDWGCWTIRETQGSPGRVRTAAQGFGGRLRAMAHHKELRGSMGS